MALICSYCEGDGYIHRAKCTCNETFDESTCNCDRPKCSHCSHKELIRKKNYREKNKNVVHTVSKSKEETTS